MGDKSVLRIKPGPRLCCHSLQEGERFSEKRCIEGVQGRRESNTNVNGLIESSALTRVTDLLPINGSGLLLCSFSNMC